MKKPLTHNLRKRFVKDCSFPISLFQDPYFDYFLDLYEPLYKSRSMYNTFSSLVEKLGDEESFFVESKRITDSIIGDISNTFAFDEFNNSDLKQYQVSNKEGICFQNIYHPQNVEGAFASFDLVKANYQSLKFFNPEIVFNTKTYEELLGRYTNEEYFIKSKHIRQIIFGHLNPKKQIRIQKYIIQNNVIPEIQKIISDMSRYISASEDEVVVRLLPFEFLTEDYINGLKNFKSGVSVRYNTFVLKQLGDKPYYYKQFGINSDPSIEFKAIPLNYFAECFRYYYNQEPTEYDMCTYHDGRVVKYLEPIFYGTP